MAVLKTFDVPGRGFQGSRNLIESGDQLRQYLTEDGVIFDDSTLSAALTYWKRQHSRGSILGLSEVRSCIGAIAPKHLPAARMPSPAMLLEQVHMWDYKVDERADIEPYLIPAQGA